MLTWRPDDSGRLVELISRSILTPQRLGQIARIAVGLTVLMRDFDFGGMTC